MPRTKSTPTSAVQIALALLIVLSVSACPALAESSVEDQIETVRASFAHASLEAVLKDNQISAVTVTEVGVEESPPTSTARASMMGAYELQTVDLDENNVHIHVQNPMTGIEHAPVQAQAQEPALMRAGMGMDLGAGVDQPVDSGLEVVVEPALPTPLFDADVLPNVVNLTAAGYTFTGTSHHTYETAIESEKLRGIDPDKLAAAGAKVSEDGKTVTVLESVDYYVFDDRITGTSQTIVVGQLLGLDGVTPLGERSVGVINSTGWWDKTKNWVCDHPIVIGGIATAVILTAILTWLICSGELALIIARVFL